MKTKAVYVVVSGDSDIYFEQAWVSAWSLKHFNPDMRVECVVDSKTYDSIQRSYRKKAEEVIDLFIPVETPEECNNMETSRWLKTSLREHVDGDYLFIDTDTIICGKLDEIDGFSDDLMMVLDYHCNFQNIPHYDYLRRKCERIFSQPLNINQYFNSGVIYVKDTDKAYSFYEKWHKNWLYSKGHGIATDQQSLAVTNEELQLVKELDGAYNCQIINSIKYLYNAKIMHFFATKNIDDSISPFVGKTLFQQIKENKDLTDEIKSIAISCKSQFPAPSSILVGDGFIISTHNVFEYLLFIKSRYPIFYLLINKMSKWQLSILKRF